MANRIVDFLLNTLTGPLANPQPKQNPVLQALNSLLPTNTQQNAAPVAQAADNMVMGSPRPGAFDDVEKIDPFAEPSPQAVTRAMWQSRYQPIYDKVSQELGIPPEVVQLLVTSENGKELADYVNKNSNNTVDVGLLQVNANPNDQERITALQDPETNIKTGLGIYKQRLQHLEDPLLALASYNLGARGAVTNPEKALNRALHLYQHNNLPVPETEFKKDPSGFVNKRKEMFKKLGILE